MLSRAFFSILAVFAFLGPTAAHAQQVIDGSFPFDSDPDKDYSLYIPSSYDAGTPNPLMLGFHPLNTSRWNAMSWRDTLIVFAEENDLILACPDGGPDGRVDDPIDLAFTTALLDSVETWFSIDTSSEFVMGFSWGGRATYRYGLANADRFAGFMPIGAAVQGTSTFNDDLPNANGKPFYLVHGSLDATSSRFFPPRDSLIANGACVDFILMPGVGHTIDFPNRNAILGEAFEWLDAVVCEPAVAIPTSGEQSGLYSMSPNPLPVGGRVLLSAKGAVAGVDVYDPAGRRVLRIGGTGTTSVSLETQSLAPGVYWVRVTAREGAANALRESVQKLVIAG